MTCSKSRPVQLARSPLRQSVAHFIMLCSFPKAPSITMRGIGWIPSGQGKPVCLAKDLQMVIVKSLQLVPDPGCEDIKATQESSQSWLAPLSVARALPW